MLIGQMLVGMILGLASGTYAYLALDASIWLAVAIYSGVGAGALLLTAGAMLLSMRPEQPENGPAGSLPDFAG